MKNHPEAGAPPAAGAANGSAALPSAAPRSRGAPPAPSAIAAKTAGPARVLVYDDAHGTHSPQQPARTDGGAAARRFCADVAAFLLAPEDELRIEAEAAARKKTPTSPLAAPEPASSLPPPFSLS